MAVFLSALTLIAIHNAWQSFECPLLLSVATLVCIMIKSKKMNRERRNELKKVVELLNQAKALVDESMEVVERCKDDEEECYDNLPESLQDGDKGDAMQDNIDAMDGVLSELETAGDTISEQVDAINEVIER